MHNTYKLLDIDLRLFDGAAAGSGAGGAAPAGDGAQQDGGSALPKADAKKSTGSSRRSKAGAYDNVVFGKQDAAETEAATPVAGETNGEGNAKTGVTTTSDSLEAKREAFRNMTKGEYKDQFAEEVQGIINRRFKETKGMEASLAAQKPIMDALMQRYNVTDGDAGKILKALEKDDRFWEEAAEEAGYNSVEQYRKARQLAIENEAFKRARANEAAQRKLGEWQSEAEKVKQVYPGFNFEAEVQNTHFTDLLKKGVSVQQAYELVHRDEINAAIAKNAAQTAGQQMAAKIQNKAARPAENGMSSQSAVIVKNDVHSLSRADRAEAARQAMRGKKIKW